MKNSILIILLLAFFTELKGEISYLKIDGSFIEYGVYDSSIRKKKVQEYEIDEIDKLATKYHSSSELKVLYYIHSMYGGFGPYHKDSIKKLQEIKGYDKIVCIEWSAKKLGYKKTWEYTIEQGEQIGELMDLLLSRNRNSILCHSMGNRLFEGISTKLTAGAKVERIILAASDIEMNSFSDGEEFITINAKEIIVLVNRKDQLLRISKLIHKKDRMGLDGTEALLFTQFQDKGKIVVWDVTDEVGQLRYGFGHVYFKRKDSVFARIKETLES